MEARQLETDISGLRGVCDDLSNKVHTMTAGKVPLGETSIKFENYLTPPEPADQEMKECRHGIGHGRLHRKFCRHRVRDLRSRHH